MHEKGAGAAVSGGQGPQHSGHAVVGLTPQQHDLACGLLLTGATFTSVGEGEGAALQVESESEQFVDWLESHFERPTSREDTGDTITWRSPQLAAFNRYQRDWQSEGTVQAPQGYVPAPEALRVLFARAGGTRHLSESLRIYFDLGATTLTCEQAESILAEYHPMVFGSADSDDAELYLQATDEFFEAVSPTPVPGHGDSWADEYCQERPAIHDECPFCGEEFAHLEAHWQASATCNFPQVSYGHHEAIAGLLLGGAELHRGVYGTSVVVRSGNRDLLSFLDTEFGPLSRGIRAAEDGGLLWETRSLPSLTESYSAWGTPRKGAQKPDLQMPENLALSQRLLKVAYALAGRRGGACVAIDLPEEWAEPPLLREFFEEFDPIVDGDTVELHCLEKFFGYIGGRPLPGCVSKWPTQNEVTAVGSPY